MISKTYKQTVRLLMIRFLTFCLCTDVAVIDAGSTGTRLHIYNFDKEQILEKKAFMYPKPIRNDTVEEIMSALLKNIDEKIPVGFYGTAGLRASKDKEGIIRKVSNSMKSYNYQAVKILTATEEAVGLLDAFKFFNPNLESFLLVDMGGMSTQVIHKNGDNINIKLLDTGIAIKTDIMETVPDDSIAFPTEIYMFSALSDIFGPHMGSTICEAEKTSMNNCIMNNTPTCKDINFAINVIHKLKIPCEIKINQMKQLSKMYISWPIGVALNLAKSEQSKYLLSEIK